MPFSAGKGALVFTCWRLSSFFMFSIAVGSLAFLPFLKGDF